MTDEREVPEAHEPDRERDKGGRFARGNRTSRRGGNPNLRHSAQLLGAVRAAGTPARMRAVLNHLHKLALKGDVHAARVWLERVAGRPRETPSAVALELPTLTDAETIAEALRRVAQGAASGELDLDEAAKVAALVRAVGDATVVEDLARRVAEIESERGAL